MALITISPDFRTIQVPTGLILAVEGDQNVLTVNFTMARYYNGIDLSEYALKINYINAGGCGDIYLITDPEVQEEQILFNWTIGQNAAAYRGRLTFALEATKTDEAGTVTNELHTMPASVRIPATVDVCTGAAETALSDLLAQLMKIAGEAQQSATEAAQSATQAARSEEQAGEYADRAEASAYNAGLAKEQAQAARTGAEAAQTAAESARTAAGNSSTRAANSATAAAGSAQEAADSRTEAAEHLAELTGEKLSGETVSYAAENNLPIEDLIIDIQGSQDLNGYRSPWVGGAGANLFDINKATMAAPSFGLTISADGDKIRIQGTSTESGRKFFRIVAGYADDSLSGKNYKIQALNATGGAFTTIYGFRTETEKDVAVGMELTAGEVVDMWFNLSVSATTQTEYTPYENICPITAYTGRTITQQGKNLLESSTQVVTSNGITFTPQSDGSIIVNGTATGASVFALSDGNLNAYTTAIFKSGVPIVATTSQDGRGLRFRYNCRYTDGSYGQLPASVAEFTPTKDIGVMYFQIAQGTSVNNETIYPMVTLPTDTATEYEPYQHEETVVSWETEAGEVYKGTLNINTGVLTVDYKKLVCTGVSEWWTRSNTSNVGMTYFFRNGAVDAATTDDYICDSFDIYYGKMVASTPINHNMINISNADVSSRLRVMIQTDLLPADTVAGFGQWLSANPITIYYRLATPITYQLTPQEVRNLIGRQTLSSDTGAIVNAWIRTGEETYIDKRTDSIEAKIEALPQVKYIDFVVDGTTNAYRSGLDSVMTSDQQKNIISAQVIGGDNNSAGTWVHVYRYGNLRTWYSVLTWGSFTVVSSGTYTVRIYYYE